MDVDTRDLRAFVAVVDEGTFTDAAIRLRTSQASVSRAVQRLETALTKRLLVRSSRQVELTPAGHRVLVHARRTLATLTQMELAAARSDEELRVGYAWAALGAHTVAVQRDWERHQPSHLVFVQHNTPTAGLLEGTCEISVVRREVSDQRLETTQVGTERRYAALAADHPLTAHEVVRLVDFADLSVAVDLDSGTTHEDLWRATPHPPRFRVIHGVDEWLTLIASGRAVGMSSESTGSQNPRPGVVFRPVEDAPPIAVWVVWWKDNPPGSLETFVETCRKAYGGRLG